MAEFATDWREKAAFMREVNATAATWDEEGRLRSIALGPIIHPANPETQSKKPLTDEQRRAEFRRQSLASTSRLVPVSRGNSGQ